ncbi:putative nucleoporin [Helianthus anomalus]
MSVITFRNSIEKNQLVWVGPTPSAIFLTQEALLWKDGLLFVGKDSFLVTVLFYHYWLYVQSHSDDSALGIIMLYFNQKIFFILLPGPKDVKDILTTLKDSVEDISGSANIVKNQITFSLLVSLIISLISDALSASPDEMSILSRDASFRRDFHETVMAIGNDQKIEGCMHCVRLAWAVHLMILQDVTDASEINNDVRNINSCLEVVFSNNVFQFLIDKALRTPAYQNDDEDMIYLCSILRSSS